ncbi:MAG: twin-arginine translocase subunit TatC [Lachnospiraceae bacterium]|nr:twin-arginine translocase subunit TatC [Lachnospiraceae bacterium]
MATLGKAKKIKNEEGVMGLTDHLREFRNRLAVVGILFIVLMFASFTFSQDILNAMLETGRANGYQLQVVDPTELFLSAFRISIFVALAVDSPFILYEVFAFAAPGLKKNEKQFLLFLLVCGFGFFVLGALFAYNIMVPFMLKFLFQFNKMADVVYNVSVANYMALYVSMMLALGCVFEMPVLVVLLTQLGFLRPEWMVAGRRVAIVLMFVLGAAITPPDIVSQCMVAIPLIGLYELSILFSKIVWKRRLARNPYLAEEEEERQKEREAERAEEERRMAEAQAAAKKKR